MTGLLIVGLAVAVALVYFVVRLRRGLKSGPTACEGCEMGCCCGATGAGRFEDSDPGAGCAVRKDRMPDRAVQK